MAKRRTSAPEPRGLTYADAGVDLVTYDGFIDSLDGVLRRTHTPRVIPNPGGFAGLFRLDFNEKLFKRNYKDPVLVACNDGVGTKVKIASAVGVYDTVGIDLVAMSVNDLIVQGAEPLFFLDYIAVARVDRPMLDGLIRGIARGCAECGCALLGGETAEMPDVYPPGEFDLAGFAVGVVELARVTGASPPRPGDVVLGLASSGVHSNGYSLVRRVVEHAGLDLGRVYPELSPPAPKGTQKRARAGARARGPAPDEPAPPTLGRVLLTPTRLYAPSIVKLLRNYRVKKVVTGMAHITGGGLGDNLARALTPKVDAVIRDGAWPVPPVFDFLQAHGGISDDEMRRVFNRGIGYCLIVRPTFAEAIAEKLEKLGERVHAIGRLVKGTGQVRYE